MLLRYKFDEHEVNQALEVFLRGCSDCWGEDLVSVIVYGSLTLDDLAPGYGDLDFLAVVENDIPEAMFQRVSDFRRPLKSGRYGVIASMIEGEFVPRKSLVSPGIGQSYYWGTKSDRPRTGCSIHGIVARVIREQSIVIYGEDIRGDIPMPDWKMLSDELQGFVRSVREHGRGGTLHSLDWLLMAARFLFLLREDRLISKSEAADWGALNASGEWRYHLPKAKELRSNPSMAESAHSKQWLGDLTGPIQQACDELEQTLAGVDDCR